MDNIIFTRPTEKDENVDYFLNKVAPANVTKADFDKIPHHGCLVWSPKSGDRVILNKDYLPINDIKASPDAIERRDYLIREMGKMLDVFPSHSQMAKCHLEFLLRSINPFIINIADFSVVLRSANIYRPIDPTEKPKHGNGIVISLIDYRISCQRESQPKRKLILLHQYLCNLVTVPDVLIQNKFMLGLS